MRGSTMVKQYAIALQAPFELSMPPPLILTELIHAANIGNSMEIKK